MTTAIRRELARKQPANLPARPEPDPQVINGHVVVRGNGHRIAGVLLLALLAFLFAGFLLSTV